MNSNRLKDYKERLQQGEVISVPVKSSMITTWVYNPISKDLTVLFNKKQSMYKYQNVEVETVHKLLYTFLKSNSIGKKFWEIIRDKHECIKISSQYVLSR